MLNWSRGVLNFLKVTSRNCFHSVVEQNRRHSATGETGFIGECSSSLYSLSFKTRKNICDFRDICVNYCSSKSTNALTHFIRVASLKILKKTIFKSLVKVIVKVKVRVIVKVIYYVMTLRNVNLGGICVKFSFFFVLVFVSVDFLTLL